MQNMLRAARIDPLAPSDFARADDLMQRVELEQLPGSIADAIAAARKLTRARRRSIEEAIRDPAVSGEEILRKVERLSA